MSPTRHTPPLEHGGGNGIVDVVDGVGNGIVDVVEVITVEYVVVVLALLVESLSSQTSRRPITSPDLVDVVAQTQTNWRLTVPVTCPRTLQESPSLTSTAATANEDELDAPIVFINGNVAAITRNSRHHCFTV